MDRINKAAGTEITIYHNFNDEVNHYRAHIWKCNGPCKDRPPYYGLVKRSMNRPPQPADNWWSIHQLNCGGTFIKISEPPKTEKKKPEKRRPKNDGLKKSTKRNKREIDSVDDIPRTKNRIDNFFQKKLGENQIEAGLEEKIDRDYENSTKSLGNSITMPKTSKVHSDAALANSNGVSQPELNGGYRLGGVPKSWVSSKKHTPESILELGQIDPVDQTDSCQQITSSTINPIVTTVQCPICKDKNIAESNINDHIDLCLWMTAENPN